MSNEIRYGRKRRGIVKELNKKIEDWVDSIDDPTLKQTVMDNVIVTGGSIASMLLGEPINDFDVYFKDKQAVIDISNYYIKRFNEKRDIRVEDGVLPIDMYVKEHIEENIKGVLEDRVSIYIKSSGVVSEDMGIYAYFEQKPLEELEKFSESLIKEVGEDDGKEKYRVVFISENAITLSHKIQIIVRFFGEPERIHDNYDFVHAMNYFDYKTQNLCLKPEALEALLSRTLVYKGSLYPIASIFRTKKFIERGWRVNAGQLLKMAWQVSEIDLTDLNTMRQQLTGVDMAYLYQVVESLKDVDPEKVNATYVSEIIDRIFD